MRTASRIVSLLLTVALIVGILPSMGLAADPPFEDVPGNAWYYVAVSYVNENGIMTGTAANQFSPEMEVTRAQMCQILYNMEGKPASSGSAFSDVSNADWFYSAVNWAASVGIVSGVGNGEFAPNTPITREQAMTILYNYASYKGYDITVTSSLEGFTDASQISSWASAAMEWAVGSGYLSGVSQTELQPYGATTRAQMAMVLMRFSEKQVPNNTPANTSTGGNTIPSTPSGPSYDEDTFKAFKEKDMDDFDGYEILNLDDSTETNFAVLKKGTIVTNTVGTTNQLVQMDDEHGVYVIENINEDIANLKPGDSFFFTYGDTTRDCLLLKVGSVTVEDGTATITVANDAELFDCFEYIDIDMRIAIPADDEPQAQLLSDDDPEIEVTPHSPITIINIQEDAYDFLVQDTVTITTTTYYYKETNIFGVEKEKIKEQSVVAEQTFDVTATLKKGTTFELSDKITNALTLEKTVLLPYGFDLTVSITPVLNFTPEASISSHFSYSCEAGYKHDHLTHHIEEIESSSKHNLSVSAKASFTGNVGARLAISLNWLRIVESTEVGVTATLEIMGEVEKSISTAQSTEKHICKICIDGDLNLSFTVDFSEKFFCIEIVGSDDLLTWKKHLTKFYVSFLNENSLVDFGWGECPHKSYLVTITVKDKDGTVPGASLLISGNGIEPINAETNKNGVYKTYLADGTYTIYAESSDEENFKTDKFTVDGKSLSISIIVSKDGEKPVKPVEPDTPEPNKANRQWDTIAAGFDTAIIDTNNCLWYFDNYGAKKVMDDAVSVSMSDYNGTGTRAVIKSDKTLWMWGNDNYGQLGIGSTSADGTYKWIDTPKKVLGLDNVVAVSCGPDHTAAITADNAVWTWGENHVGELGDGTRENRTTPVKIMDNVKDVCARMNASTKFITTDNMLMYCGGGKLVPSGISRPIFVDLDEQAYLDIDGSMWICYMRLHDEVYWTKDTKVMDNVISISSCGDHHAAIRTDGSLWVWGENDYGQIGDGTTESSLEPVHIMDDVAAVCCGIWHTVAVKTDGTVWVWGLSNYNFFFENDYENDVSLVPIQIPGFTAKLPSDVE